MSDYLNKKGKVITFNEIQKEAERTGQTTEALIKLFELVKAPEKPGKGLGTVVKDANAVPQVNQPANTGSASENTSSGFQDSNNQTENTDRKYDFHTVNQEYLDSVKDKVTKATYWNTAENAKMDLKNPETLVDKDEDSVVPYLQNTYGGIIPMKRTSFFGDAFQYEKNGEWVEIDLQPYTYEGKEEAKRKLIELDNYYKSFDTDATERALATNLIDYNNNVFDKGAKEQIEAAGYSIRTIDNKMYSALDDGVMPTNSLYVLTKNGKKIATGSTSVIQKAFRQYVTEEDIDLINEKNLVNFDAVQQLIKEKQSKVKLSKKNKYSLLEDFHLNSGETGYSKMMVSYFRQENILNEDELTILEKYFNSRRNVLELGLDEDTLSFGIGAGDSAKITEYVVETMHDLKGLPIGIQEKLKNNINDPYFKFVDLLKEQALLNKKTTIHNRIVNKNQGVFSRAATYKKLKYEEKAKVISNRAEQTNKVSKGLLASVDKHVQAIVNKYPAGEVKFKIGKDNLIVGMRFDDKDGELSSKQSNEFVKELSDYVETRNKIVQDYNETIVQLKKDNEAAFVEGYVDENTIKQAYVNTNSFDILSKDAHDAGARLALSIPTIFNSDFAIEEEKRLQVKDSYFPSIGTYDEEGIDLGFFALRTLAQQLPNTALAIGGTALGIPPIAIAGVFGLSSGTQKFRTLSLDKRASEQAKLQLIDLKKQKPFMDPAEYNFQVTQLNKQIAYGNLSPGQILGASVTSGVIEGGLMYVIGTIPNALKLLKNFRGTDVGKVIKLSGMNKAQRLLYQTGEIAKPILGEVTEETAIYTGDGISEFLILNRDIDILDQLDDTAVTAIIMAGPMNAPGGLYSNAINASVAKQYREAYDPLKKSIETISLQIESASDKDKPALMALLESKIGEVADLTGEMEIDALGLGADNIKKIINFNFILSGLYNKAGVTSSDSKETAQEKIDAHAKKLGKRKGKEFKDQIDGMLKEIQNVQGQTDINTAKAALGPNGERIANELKESNEDGYNKKTKRQQLAQVLQVMKDNAVKDQIIEIKRDKQIVEMVESLELDGEALTEDQKEQEYTDIANTFLNRKGLVLSTKLDIDTNAAKILNAEQLKNIDVVGINTIEEFEAELRKLKLTENEIQATLTQAKNLLEQDAEGRSNGVIVPLEGKAKLITFDKETIDQRLKDGQITAGTMVLHEISHAIDDAAFTSAAEQTIYSNNLKSFLSNSSNKTYNGIHLNALADSEALLDGNGKPASEDTKADEYTRRAQELLYVYAQNAETEETFLGKVAAKVGIGLNINTPQKAFDYTIAHNAAFRRGEISSKAKAKIKRAKGGVDSEVKASSVESINEQMDALDESLNDGVIDFDTYNSQMESLEAKLEAAEKGEVVEEIKIEKPKPKVEIKAKPVRTTDLGPRDSRSQKIMDTYNEGTKGKVRTNYSAKNPLPEGLESKLVPQFEGYINTIVDQKFRQTTDEAFNKEDALAVLRAEIPKALRTFNPNKNKDLAGYVKKLIQARQSLMFKNVNKQFTTDIDTAKGIAVEEDSAPTLDEKSKYKNLLQQKVLSTEGLKQVRSKMITIVRVLKSKLDTAISKNANTTPIINEIRLAAGKQLDLTFKEEMGGKKGLKLRNWTIENKQAIVENAPTTWLMGKDSGSKVQGGLPIAIEKSVNGKFLPYPEWVGQKIDREDTEGRGQTSGNQVVRRVSSAKIDDTEFANFVTKENGTPIPGRKEALAKMLAEETAFDLLKLDMETDGPVFEALKTNQEALGVTITEVVKQEVSRQIERGNVKFSGVEVKNIMEGLNILLNNQVDMGSIKYQEWYSSLGLEDKNFWDKIVAPMFAKMSDAVKRHVVKNLDQLKEIFPSLETAFDAYSAATLNGGTNPEVAQKQLDDAREGISRKIGNALAKLSGFNFYSETTRYGKVNEKTAENIASAPVNESKELKAKRLAAEKAINKAVIYNGAKPVNEIKEFITNFLREKGTPSEIKDAFEKSGLALKSKEAKEANAAIFEYINFATLEYVLESEDKNKAYAGVLRLLETNNSNASGIRSLAFLAGFEIVSDQGVYINPNENNRAYYSKGGFEVVETLEKGERGLLINKNHTNWSNAETYLESKGRLKGLKGFKRDAKIAEGLQTMLEHQKSMGETSIALLTAIAQAAESQKNGHAVEDIYSVFGTEVKKIYSDFGLVLNSSFIGDMQNDLLGSTSKLKKGRLIALTNELSDNIFNLQGEKLVVEGKKEIVGVVQQLVKAYKISNENNAKVKESKPSKPSKLSREFNEMIARQKGVEVDAEYSKIVAKRMGAKIGKYKFYLPSSAEDFRLLTGYTFSGKGKQGTADMKWFEDNLIRPYTKAIAAIDKAKQTTKNDFKALNKAMPKQAKSMGNLIPSKDYTNDQAVRVYLWHKAGYNIPGLNEKEVNKLVAYVTGNPELGIYADALLAISKSKKWLKPGEHWDVQTILSDINNLTEKGGRKAYLANWIENVDAIFSEENMNKIEALYGKRHREALEDALYRMKNGTNRPSGANAQVNRWNTWLNNSIGSIMFFNRRSALLQLLSTTNFLNWSDNNPVNAAKAFANQKQYWADFAYIFNSDKLKQRRGGLRADVNEAEIANAAANSKNKATAALSWLLKKGFTPTQIADSFAIASGGATFYRNRINTYVEQGMDVKEAEKKAWLDFIETSDQAQQSGDPSLVSMEQASILGRMVLAFQNTTQQYSRMMKRSGLDIINRRQMPGTKSMFQSDAANFSKIMYYGALQNLIFSSLSAGLFALIPGFGDNEDEEERNKSKEEKTARILNSSIDSLIRGLGVKGAVVITIKNVIQEYFKQAKKEYRADHAYTILQAVNLSPPIGSKVKKIYSAIKGYQYDKDVIEERGLDITANGKLNLSPTYRVLGSLSAGALNLPLDRLYSEIQSIAEMLDERNTIYQRLALSLGFRSWDVNTKNEEDDLIKLESKKQIKKDREKLNKEKRKAARDLQLKNRRKVWASLNAQEKSNVAIMNKNAQKKFLDKKAAIMFPEKKE